jgi:hypothetical protein
VKRKFKQLKLSRIFIASLVIAFLPSAIPANSASPSPTPDSPTYFRTSALGNLNDLEKDISDAERALAKGGIWRLLGNAAEFSFNVGQLKSLTPPTKYAKTWNSQLAVLEAAVDQFMDDISASSVTKTKNTLRKIKSTTAALKTYVGKVK